MKIFNLARKTLAKENLNEEKINNAPSEKESANILLNAVIGQLTQTNIENLPDEKMIKNAEETNTGSMERAQILEETKTAFEFATKGDFLALKTALVAKDAQGVSLSSRIDAQNPTIRIELAEAALKRTLNITEQDALLKAHAIDGVICSECLLVAVLAKAKLEQVFLTEVMTFAKKRVCKKIVIVVGFTS